MERMFIKDSIERLEHSISAWKLSLIGWMIVLFAPFYIGMIVFLVKVFLK